MAAKRLRDDTVDPPPMLPGSAEDTVESSVEFSKPVYLVAKRCARESAYSVLMVDAAAVAGGHETPGARNLGGFPGARRGMSFVAARTKRGSWVVGVGGRRGDTIIYDPRTHKEFIGPDLLCPKHEPILISHGGKVYAISRRPKVHIDATRDFEPWFESLNFKKGIPCIYHEDCCYWKALPPPPFFPCFMTPEEFRNPPDISVSSYAAVGDYILVSLQQEDKGTYAFHVVKKTWEKVRDKSLPFVGQAVPLGSSLFAACSVSNNAATAVSVFHMSIKASSTPSVSPKLTTSATVSMQGFPVVASEGQIPWPLLCPLEKGSFCSIRKAAHQCQESNQDLQIILTAFQMDNVEATLTAEDLQVPVQLKQHDRTYELNFRPRCL